MTSRRSAGARAAMVGFFILAFAPSQVVEAPDKEKIRAGVEAAARASRTRDAAGLKAAMGLAVAATYGTESGFVELASRLYLAGLDELCVQICDQGHKSFPKTAAFRGFRGAARVRLKQNVAAVDDLAAAVAAEPKSAAWSGLLARAYLFSGREADAVRQIEAALTLAPNDASVLELKAEIAYRNQRLKDAEATCLKVVEIAPKSAAAAALLVRVRRADGRAEAAIEAADAALKRIGKNGEVSLERGTAALLLARVDEAIRDLETAAEQLPNDARPWQHLCVAYVRAGRKDDAFAAKRRHAELQAKK